MKFIKSSVVSLITMNQERQEPQSWDVLFDLSSWHPKPPQGVHYCCPIIPLVVCKTIYHTLFHNDSTVVGQPYLCFLWEVCWQTGTLRAHPLRCLAALRRKGSVLGMSSKGIMISLCRCFIDISIDWRGPGMKIKTVVQAERELLSCSCTLFS